MGSGHTNIAALLAAGAALVTAVPPTAQPNLTATTLYMGGTFSQLSVPQDTREFIDSYIGSMDRSFVEPSGLCPNCAPVGVYTPEQFWPATGLIQMTFDKSVAKGLTNLDNCLGGQPCIVTAPPYSATGKQTLTDTSFTVVSYSQSGTIAAEAKENLISDSAGRSTMGPSASADVSPEVSFVFVANPNRPNGGILPRFEGLHIPVLGVSFTAATPTDSSRTAPLTTVDVARQYDAISDFPTNPLDLLASLNALCGYFIIHVAPFGGGTPELQGQYQDSTYYLIPTPTLPLLMPMARLPVVGPFLAAVLDPPLRVLVEAGYDRTLNPGVPTRANPRYRPPLATTARNFLQAIPAGLDNGIAYVTGNPANRPLGTTPPPTYGVGGPPVYTGAVDPYGPPTPLAPSAATLAPSAATPSASSASVRAQPAAGALRRRTATPPSSGQPRPAPAVSGTRDTVLNRSAESSTGPLRSRARSAQ